MITFILGLIAGIAACDIIGRRMHSYSIVMEAVDWVRREIKH